MIRAVLALVQNQLVKTGLHVVHAEREVAASPQRSIANDWRVPLPRFCHGARRLAAGDRSLLDGANAAAVAASGTITTAVAPTRAAFRGAARPAAAA